MRTAVLFPSRHGGTSGDRLNNGSEHCNTLAA